MSCGVGHRRGSDPMLLWLWRRPAAVTPIGPLAWEPPYDEGAALKRQKTKKKRRRRKCINTPSLPSIPVQPGPPYTGSEPVPSGQNPLAQGLYSKVDCLMEFMKCCTAGGKTANDLNVTMYSL